VLNSEDVSKNTIREEKTWDLLNDLFSSSISTQCSPSESEYEPSISTDLSSIPNTPGPPSVSSQASTTDELPKEKRARSKNSNDNFQKLMTTTLFSLQSTYAAIEDVQTRKFAACTFLTPEHRKRISKVDRLVEAISNEKQKNTVMLGISHYRRIDFLCSTFKMLTNK
jgi:hypothetical protein